MLKFSYDTSIAIHEVGNGSITISGTLLVEGVSKNHRLYELAEMEKIAEQTVGVPIISGIKKVVGSDGKLRTLHDDSPVNTVGKITKTTLKMKQRKIDFVGQIWNTPKYPHIVQEVKQCWGISIGGIIASAHEIFDKVRGKLIQIKDMIVQHVCLIPPNISRGQDAAQVETVNEVLMLYEDESNTLSNQELRLVIRALKEGGYL
jgi:hypothetical protein